MREFQIYTLAEKPVYTPSGWDIAPKGRFGFIAKALWSILHRFGWLSQQKEVSYKVLRLPPPESLFDSIWSQINGMYSIDRKPSEILIGPDTLCELVSCPELRGYGYQIEAAGRGYYNGSPFDIPIRVLPQMEGVIVT